MAALWVFVKAWWKPILFLVLLAVAFYYRTELTKTEASLTQVNGELNLAKDEISDMQRRQRDVAALDEKYSGELADAQGKIDQLERDVAAGRQRLRLNATCGKNATASTTGMDDGTGPRLTDAAQRDYFTLRERIETVTSQLNGLQQYVRDQCLK
ncbi:lysis protein [Cronobacter sakazakii]|uniref:lysis protein n=1 Tax=Cronobacter sakazakii TaxID=28141 RepID=UPI00294B4F87|nr:lysis protein [Cronobacter sakazakii]